MLRKLHVLELNNQHNLPYNNGICQIDKDGTSGTCRENVGFMGCSSQNTKQKF